MEEKVKSGILKWKRKRKQKLHGIRKTGNDVEESKEEEVYRGRQKYHRKYVASNEKKVKSGILK